MDTSLPWLRGRAPLSSHQRETGKCFGGGGGGHCGSFVGLVCFICCCRIIIFFPFSCLWLEEVWVRGQRFGLSSDCREERATRTLEWVLFLGRV